MCCSKLSARSTITVDAADVGGHLVVFDVASIGGRVLQADPSDPVERGGDHCSILPTARSVRPWVRTLPMPKSTVQGLSNGRRPGHASAPPCAQLSLSGAQAHFPSATMSEHLFVDRRRR